MAHYENKALFRLCKHSKWIDAAQLLDQLAHAEAVRQASWTSSHGTTCAAFAVTRGGPLSLISRLLKIGGVQVLRATAHNSPPSTLSGVTILRAAANFSNYPAVFRLLIREAPDLVVATDSHGDTPLTALQKYHLERSNHAELLSLTRNCVAAYERKDYFTLIRQCGISRPLAAALKPQVTVWLALLRHRDDPSFVVSAGTTIVVSLLSRLYDHERGIVREIMSYIGSNAAPLEDESWKMNELLKLTRQNAEMQQTIATQATMIASLTQTINSQQQTIAYLAASNKRSRPN